MKRDYEILNYCISFDENHKIHVKVDPKQMMRESGVRGNSDDDGSESDLSNRAELTNRSSLGLDKSPEQLKPGQQGGDHVTMTEEYFEAKLHIQRVKMSMRRNILRRTQSEDLYWAECQKREPNSTAVLFEH